MQLKINLRLTMAVNDWSATRTFLLKHDLWLAMAVKYWYTIQIDVDSEVLNNMNKDLRFVVLC